jgi:CRP/FNR family transcriptional regulator, cyclic AMP receptor protein
MRLFSQDTKVQALKGVPLFEDLSRKELVQLERVCEDLEVEPGKVLCRQGQTGHEFFVIVDGKLQVTRTGRRVATLGSGDFVGEIALVTGLPRTATVTAETGAPGPPPIVAGWRQPAPGPLGPASVRMSRPLLRFRDALSGSSADRLASHLLSMTGQPSHHRGHVLIALEPGEAALGSQHPGRHRRISSRSQPVCPGQGKDGFLEVLGPGGRSGSHRVAPPAGSWATTQQTVPA